MMTKPKKTTKEDLRVTDLGSIEPLYNEFDGDMYGTNSVIHMLYISCDLTKATFFRKEKKKTDLRNRRETRYNTMPMSHAWQNAL
jgi:hypothetical protein